jgi:nucleotide-binding universal stress UspA family protein
MYDHILIPVIFDQDRDPGQAIKVAKALASPKARLSLVHVIEALPVHVEDSLTAEFKAANRKKAQERLETLAKDNDIGSTALLSGHAGRKIADWAQENGADCIVISSHKPVFSDIFLGSTAAWVVRHAACAVHVLR